MDWHALQRRLPLPLAGCVLGVGGYLAILHPASAGASQSVLEALRLDSGSPERWADMAEAMHEAGRDNDTRYGLEQEIRRSGHLPHAAMRAAQMYFRLGDSTAALALTHRIVSDTHEYDPNVFQVWQRLGGTAEQVFTLGVVNNQTAGRGYFRFLLDAGDAAATAAAWTELKKKGMAGVEESRFYAASLASSREYAKAAEIEESILPQGVWNGGFENDWTARGLDWVAEGIPGVTVSRDTADPHSGMASMRLDFDGRSREEFNSVYETRTLSGGGWTLRATVRTNLKGTALPEHGVGLFVADAESGRLLAVTKRSGGKSDWTWVEAKFEAGNQPRAVRIGVLRPQTPPSELTMTGSAWIDDVTLMPEKAR